MLAVLAACQPAQAESAAVSAVRAMADRQWSYARSRAIASNDPVTMQVYEWMVYTRAPEGMNFERIAAFIKRHPHWPGQDDLRMAAEKALPESGNATAAIEWFTAYPPVSGDGMRKYLAALQAAGQTSRIGNVLNAGWPELKTDPKNQAFLVSQYGRVITRDSHRRRIDNLLLNDRDQLARDLAQRIGQGYPQLVEARLGLSQNKPGASSLIARVPSALQNDPGLLYERLRFRRKNDDNDGAIQILNNAPAAGQIMNGGEWWKERHIVIRRLLERRQYQKAYQLAA